MRRRPVSRFGLAVGAIAVLSVALRVFVMVGYRPANLSYGDESSYVLAASGNLFANPYRPAGYSLFLRVVHAFSASLPVTIAVQQAVGLATAVLVYLVARRTGATRWVALLPAALVAVSGDQLYLEHVLLTEVVFIALLLAGCYCALRAFDSSSGVRRAAWLTGASVLVAGLGTVRTVGVVLVPLLIGWALLVAGAGWRQRMIAAGIPTLIAVALLLAYAFGQQHATGVFGLSRFSGWPLYARVAPFADCTAFTPPAGTREVCQPPRMRPGPDFYLWDSRSPARRAYGFPPSHGAQLAAFARSAIEHQPGQYLLAVARDVARYVDPGIVGGLGWGGDYTALSLNARNRSVEALNLPSVRSYWHASTVHVNRTLMRWLEGWRRVFRIHGVLIALSAVLAAVGLWLAPDARTRRALALLVVFAAALFVAPVMANVYQARYGVPAAVLLLIAAARGGELAARLWFARAASRPA